MPQLDSTKIRRKSIAAAFGISPTDQTLIDELRAIEFQKLIKFADVSAGAKKIRIAAAAVCFILTLFLWISSCQPIAPSENRAADLERSNSVKTVITFLIALACVVLDYFVRAAADRRMVEVQNLFRQSVDRANHGALQRVRNTVRSSLIAETPPMECLDVNDRESIWFSRRGICLVDLASNQVVSIPSDLIKSVHLEHIALRSLIGQAVDIGPQDALKYGIVGAALGGVAGAVIGTAVASEGGRSEVELQGRTDTAYLLNVYILDDSLPCVVMDFRFDGNKAKRAYSLLVRQ